MVAANASAEKGAARACKQGKNEEKRGAKNGEVSKGKSGGKGGSKGKSKGKSGREVRYVTYNSDPCRYDDETAPFLSTHVVPSVNSLQSGM